PPQRLSFLETLLDRLRTLPGIRAAGIATSVPGEGYGGDNGFTIAEHPPLPLDKTPYAIHRWADPGYFAALGIPLLRGQIFDKNQRLEKDRKSTRLNSSHVAISYAVFCLKK